MANVRKIEAAAPAVPGKKRVAAYARVSAESEQMLTILASFAQEESESISRNEKWAVRKGFEHGENHKGLRCFGYDWDAGGGGRRAS